MLSLHGDKRRYLYFLDGDYELFKTELRQIGQEGGSFFI